MRCCAKCSTPGYGCANAPCRCHKKARDGAPELTAAEQMIVARFGLDAPELLSAVPDSEPQ